MAMWKDLDELVFHGISFINLYNIVSSFFTFLVSIVFSMFIKELQSVPEASHHDAHLSLHSATHVKRGEAQTPKQ